MKLTISRLKINSIFFNAIFTCLFFLLYNITGVNDLKTITIIGIIQYVWMTISWYKVTKNVINVYLFFIILSFCFYLGQPILYLLGIRVDNVMFITNSPFGMIAITKTLTFMLKAMALFHFGSSFAVKHIQKKEISFNKNKAMIFVGTVLFLISIVPQISFAVESLTTTFTVGYANIFKSQFVQGAGLDGGLPRLLAGFFEPSLLLLILGNKDNKKRRNFWFIFAIGFTLAMIVSGQRGSNTLFLIALALLKHYAIKPFTKSQIIKYGLAGMIGLVILSLISSVRNVSFSNLSYSQILTIMAENNLITNLFGEMGFTLLACTTVMVYSPALIPLNNGVTYLNSFLALIPNLFWEVHPAASGSVDQVFKGYLMNNSGMGSSFIIEAYYNFGNYALFIIPIFGYIFAKMYFGILESSVNKDYTKLFIWLSLVPTLLWFVRSETLVFWRTFGYYTLIPLCLIGLYRVIAKYQNPSGSISKMKI